MTADAATLATCETTEPEAPIVRYVVDVRLHDPGWQPSGPFTLPPNAIRLSRSWSTSRRIAALVNLHQLKRAQYRGGIVHNWAALVSTPQAAGVLMIFIRAGFVPGSPFDFPPNARRVESTSSEFREMLTQRNAGQFSRGWWTVRVRPLRTLTSADSPLDAACRLSRVDAALFGSSDRVVTEAKPAIRWRYRIGIPDESGAIVPTGETLPQWEALELLNRIPGSVLLPVYR